MQLIYEIKLPGPALLGEGKPENQNHAIIFTRGEGLQTIDMNQVPFHDNINVLDYFLVMIHSILNCITTRLIHIYPTG